MNFWSLLSPARRSKKVASECCICRNPIGYVFFPENANEQFELLRFSDIDQVNICECGAIRHLRCSSEKQQALNKQNRGGGAAGCGQLLQQEMTRSNPDFDAVKEALDRDTAALGCPRCGSFKCIVGVVQEDGSVITLKEGRRRC